MSPQQHGQLVQINVNPEGGVPKHAVPSARIHSEGVEGDRQRYLEFHGGPLRAVSLYSAEHIAALKAEGHPISPGSTGENLTISGLDWEALGVGDRLRIGAEVEIEITNHASPCENIGASFADGRFKRMSQKVHPGWSRLYARVLQPGTVRTGDAVEVSRG
jgi:MOSC domain-containing protein YiiM